MKSLLLPAALLLAAGAARAEGPIGPPQGPDPMEEIRQASLKLSRALKESEDALSKLARGEKADPKAVDVSLPPKEGSPTPPSSPKDAQKGEGGPETGGETLRKSGEQGQAIVDAINRILETAGKMSKSRSGGGAGKPQETEGSDPKDEDGKQRNGKKGQEEKKDPLKDNQGKDPKDPGKPDKPDRPKDTQDKKGQSPPPPSAKRVPSPRDALGVFYAKLPDKVREAIDNGDFDRIPEKYRDLIREWTQALSAEDRKAGGGGAGGDEGR